MTRVGVNVQAFEGHFEAVLKTFPPPPNFLLALTHFSVQQLLRQSTVWHSDDRARPSGLGFLKEVVDDHGVGTAIISLPQETGWVN